jgi:hypothetical protein
VVRVVSKQRRLLTLPRTSCLVIENPQLGSGISECAAAEQEVDYGVAVCVWVNS